jgi:CDGSH-type Zn-finger protein
VTVCKPGRYAYCVCQRSARFPYCDGTHRGTEHAPIKVQLDEEKQVAWCACGTSRNKPYCDGSHRTLPPA